MLINAHELRVNYGHSNTGLLFALISASNISHQKQFMGTLLFIKNSSSLKEIVSSASVLQCFFAAVLDSLLDWRFSILGFPFAFLIDCDQENLINSFLFSSKTIGLHSRVLFSLTRKQKSSLL